MTAPIYISEADELEIADDLFDNEIYGDNSDVVVSPHDFISLTPDQLYEYFATDSKTKMVVVADRLSLSLRKKSICSLLFQKLIHGIRILAQSLLKQLAKESIKALYCSRGSCLADCLDFFKRSKRTPETLCRVF